MKEEIYFMALGGAQQVGASCYYLRLGTLNILLDCGRGGFGNVIYEPDVYSLLTSPFMESLSQLNQIFISHAHADHVAYLPELLRQSGDTPVYMTEMTEMLVEYQLYDRSFVRRYKEAAERQRLAVRHMLDSVTPVSYFQTLNLGRYQATFYPAGHIPGAMMILLQYGRRRILYTGDYSTRDTALTSGCILPEGLLVDTLILCGLHAKHPNYKKRDNEFNCTINRIFQLLDQGRLVYCRVKQLSKGVELLKILNDRIDTRERKYPVYLEDSVLNIIKKMERLSVPVLSEYNYSVSVKGKGCPHLVIGGRDLKWVPNIYEKFSIDFSLHEDFMEVAKFIKRLNPAQAVLVHCGKEYEEAMTVEQQLMCDGDCRTQFIFPEEKEIYTL